MLRRSLLASGGAVALTGAALAADFPSRAPPPVYLPPPPIMTWTGFYIGLNAGYTFGGSNSVDVDTASGVALPPLQRFQPAADAVAASATGNLSLHNSGFIGGGQIGYNLQFANSWLVGIEADIQGTGARSSASTIGTASAAGFPVAKSNISVSNALDYLGTVRGRLGFLVTPSLLIYGDGGFAYGGVHERASITLDFPEHNTELVGAPALASFSNTRTGWTAGGGLEWMVSPNLSVKAEYLYYDLGRVTFGVGGLAIGLSPGPCGLGICTVFTDPATASTRFNGHIVRAGLNYHFNLWDLGPIVAKY